MNRISYIKSTNAVKAKLFDIIINFNLIELSIRQILSDYINSNQKEFVSEVLLNNSILSFSTKLSLMKYILNKESIVFKDWEKFYKLINIRNAVAHSDNLLNFDGDIVGEELVDNEFEIRIPIFLPYLDGPKITVIKDGKVNENGLDTMHKEFNELISDLKPKLEQISQELTNK